MSKWTQGMLQLKENRDFNKWSVTYICFTRCQKTNTRGEEWQNINSKIPVSETTQAIFLPFQKWYSRIIIRSEQPELWEESKDGVVRRDRLYMMWWLIISVAVSRVWALVLSSEALVRRAVPLLIPPGRLVSPACGGTSKRKCDFLYWTHIIFSNDRLLKHV